MKKMKRFCVVCGKELEIIIAENGTIVSGGGYWKFSTKSQGTDFDPKTVGEQKEYWECEECMKDDDDDDGDGEKADGEKADGEVDEKVDDKLEEKKADGEDEESNPKKDGNEIIIVVENGCLSVDELKKLTQCIREIEQNNTDRVINIFMDTPDKTVEEMKSVINSAKPGFPYVTVVKDSDFYK